MFERVVAAYDGSEGSVAAARLAFALTSAGGRVTLLHVLELPDPELELDPGIRRLVELAREDWAGRMAALAGDAPASLTVDGDVLVAGGVARTLLDVARDNDAQLVAAGTGAGGELRQALLGSVSEQLLEHAPCSVLLVGDEPMPTAPVVVAALDGSPSTGAVLAAAERAAVALDARLVLAHVVEQRWPLTLQELTDALSEPARERGRRVLAEARASVALPPERVEERLLEGRPRTELVALSAELRPALLVVASRGDRGFPGLLLGSTARHLAHTPGRPVLVVR